MEGASGGIIIAWDMLKLKKMDKFIRIFSVSTNFSSQSSGFDWMLSKVYGPTIASNRKEFWEELHRMHSR